MANQAEQSMENDLVTGTYRVCLVSGYKVYLLFVNRDLHSQQHSVIPAAFPWHLQWRLSTKV